VFDYAYARVFYSENYGKDYYCDCKVIGPLLYLIPKAELLRG